MFIDTETRILIQGITGSIGRTFAHRMVEDGTNLVGGVTPGKRGVSVSGRSVFDTVAEAVAEVHPTASLILVPPQHVKSAALEALDAGVSVVSIYSEHVPVHDALQLVMRARQIGARIIGPNSAGLASGRHGNMSDIRSSLLRPGSIGLVSKSGTLTYEVLEGLQAQGLGVHSVVCLGGDPVVGTSYSDVLTAYLANPDISGVVLLGEIGGVAEVQAADVWRDGSSDKPIVAYIAGRFAPEGKRLGHAGAIVRSQGEGYEAKVHALREAGATIADNITDVAAATANALRHPKTSNDRNRDTSAAQA